MSTGPTVVVAPDSFKGSVTAQQAAGAMARGARSAFGPGARVTVLPMADGGEGTLDAVLGALGGEERQVDAHDALGRPRLARYGLAGTLAVIEAAEGNGLPAVADLPLQPLRADSRGVGEIARAALDAGATELLLCLGGSASTDGGTGLLTALGARFLDADGAPVAPGGGGLANIAAVDLDHLHPGARAARWRLAVDVDNPLVGPRGAAAVFGPQKGAGPAEVEVLDRGLDHLATVLGRAAGTGAEYLLSRPGAGAAGGLPLALITLLGAELVPGARLVAEATGLDAALATADVVLTGEGSLDSQSLDGKVVDAVRSLARPGAAVVVIAGRVELDAADVRAAGLTAALSIARGPADLAELRGDAAWLIEDATAQVCGLLRHDLAGDPH
ncbi:glycerate kinase [Georgenia sp. MJ173]|uniref:glycerate kinase n=1 Tax=Georgenia sunbinii TaxID=3117728 RepID=UPI002F269BCA